MPYNPASHEYYTIVPYEQYKELRDEGDILVSNIHCDDANVYNTGEVVYLSPRNYAELIRIDATNHASRFSDYIGTITSYDAGGAVLTPEIMQNVVNITLNQGMLDPRSTQFYYDYQSILDQLKPLKPKRVSKLPSWF